MRHCCYATMLKNEHEWSEIFTKIAFSFFWSSFLNFIENHLYGVQKYRTLKIELKKKALLWIKQRHTITITCIFYVDTLAKWERRNRPNKRREKKVKTHVLLACYDSLASTHSHTLKRRVCLAGGNCHSSLHTHTHKLNHEFFYDWDASIRFILLFAGGFSTDLFASLVKPTVHTDRINHNCRTRSEQKPTHFFSIASFHKIAIFAKEYMLNGPFVQPFFFSSTLQQFFHSISWCIVYAFSNHSDIQSDEFFFYYQVWINHFHIFYFVLAANIES